MTTSSGGEGTGWSRKAGLAVKVLLALAVAVLGLLVASGVHEAWGLSKPGAVALVLLALSAALWITEAVPLFVTSFVILFLSLVWLLPAMTAAGMEASRPQFLSPFFSDIILLFLGGFVLSAALHKYRLDEQVARWIIRRTGSSLGTLMLGIMLVTAVLSMFLSNTATAAMMLALVLPIVHGLKKGSPARKALILCVPFAANAGGLGTPVGSPPNAIAMQYMRELGVAPTFGMWMRVGVPGVLVLVLVAWGILLLSFRKREEIGPLECERLDLKWSWGMVVVLAVTGATVLGWLTQGFHGFSSGTVSLLPLILFFGLGLLNVRDLRSLSWDILLLMGGGLCLGVAISASGLAAWVVGLLPSGALGVYGAVLLFGVVGCVMSSLMSNTATANLIMPLIVGLSLEQTSPVLLAAAFACSLSMALPVSTPPNAMAFSSGELRVADLLKPGLLITLLGLLLALTTGYWWWRIVGFF